MGYLYLGLIVISFGSLAMFSRLSIRSGGDPYGYVFWGSACGTVLSLIMVFTGQAPLFSQASIGLGTLSALANVGAGIFFALALKTGHYGFTISILSASFILSAIYSSLVWHETIMFEGMAIILGSLVLIATSEQENEKKGQWKRWFFYIITAFFLNGAPQIAQAHVSLLSSAENSSFLFINFLVAAAVIFVITCFKGKFTGPNLYYGLLSGIGSFFGTLFTVKACGIMDKTIVFPVFFSAYNILALILSALIFKEKISLKGVIGIFLGILGVIVVSLKLTLLK